LEASQGLERTIDLLLLLAREERTKSAPAATLLLPLVEKAVLEESARFRADAFKVSISVPADAMTELDPRVAGMMISNLVSNVFRHCEGGVLRIHVDGADLVVADDGPGIPPDVEALLCGGEDGTHRGLGLSIVARLCRLHEVAVRVDRGPQGAGIRLALVSRRGTQIDISSI
jgi:signal transduction histidine kinase